MTSEKNTCLGCYCRAVLKAAARCRQNQISQVGRWGLLGGFGFFICPRRSHTTQLWKTAVGVRTIHIVKSINNNIVTARDDEGQEVIVTGKGIGFKARAGAAIPAQRIQKVYRMSSPGETERLKELFSALPTEYIELTDEIFGFAKRMLPHKLHEGAYITLADHIHFTVRRYREGMDFPNVLLSEIRRFYPAEYAIGKHALGVIERRLGVRLPDDEAASIAMHILNAEFGLPLSDTFTATKLLEDMLRILQREFGLNLETEDYFCERFVTHLKFLAHRAVKNEALPPGDSSLYALLAGAYPAEIRCGEQIAAHIQAQQHFALSQEEIAHLALHIRRVTIGDAR